MHQLVLFIHHQSGLKGDRLQEMLYLHFSDFPQERCAGLGRLRERLKHPESNARPVIYILYADTRDRLKQLQGLYDHLEGRRLILILLDNHQSTRSIGLRLLPRFIAYAGDSYNDLIAVIEKMIGASVDKQPDRETTGL